MRLLCARLMSSNEVTEKSQVRYTLTLVSHPLILVTYQKSHERFQNVDRAYHLLTVIPNYFVSNVTKRKIWGNL